MLVHRMLEEDPTLANCSLLKGATTPLCRAVYNDHRTTVIMLLKKGAEINAKAKITGRTPLMWAAYRDNLELCEFLISEGADITLEDNEGLNCFDIAVIRL